MKTKKIFASLTWERLSVEEQNLQGSPSPDPCERQKQFSHAALTIELIYGVQALWWEEPASTFS
jgi:hypothetical protein